MRKKEEREKDFQRFVDIGGLKFLEEVEIKRAEQKRDEERKKQEDEELLELFAYLVFWVLVVAIVAGSYYFAFCETPKRIINDTINSIMKGRY